METTIILGSYRGYIGLMEINGNCYNGIYTDHRAYIGVVRWDLPESTVPKWWKWI